MPSRSRFEKLARPHMHAAFNLAFWIVRDRADAEDVVQTAYLRAFRAFGGFQGEAMKPWLLMIVRNAAYRALHARRRTTVFIPFDEALGPDGEESAMEMASEAPNAEAMLIAEADKVRVHAALAELRDSYRELLVLRELEGMSYGEIAAVAEIPLGTVMSRLSRARQELRQILMRDGEGRRHAL